MAKIESLPVELHAEILRYLNKLFDRVNARRSSTLWNHVPAQKPDETDIRSQYRQVPGSTSRIPVHDVLQLYAVDENNVLPSFSDIVFGCTIENGKTKEYFIRDSRNTKDIQNPTTKTNLCESPILDAMAFDFASLLRRHGSTDSAMFQGYRSVIEEVHESDPLNEANLMTSHRRLWLDMSFAFGKETSNANTRKLKGRIRSEILIYGTTSIRDIVELVRRRVNDALKRSNLHILGPFELRFEIRSYQMDNLGRGDCDLKLCVNIYHRDEDALRENPFELMRQMYDPRDRLSQRQLDALGPGPFKAMRESMILD